MIDIKKEITELAKILSNINDHESMQQLMSEIFTESELKTISLRWALLKLLATGKTQREIASNLGISLCKITRGSKIIKDENSIIHSILIEK